LQVVVLLVLLQQLLLPLELWVEQVVVVV